jgi:hypothetical protein
MEVELQTAVDHDGEMTLSRAILICAQPALVQLSVD